MDKMKDLKILVVGTFAVMTTVGLNFRHALNDYGVLENSLHVQVLAQSNNSGGGSTNGGGSNNGGSGNMYYYQHLLGRPSKCTLYKAVNANGTVTYGNSSAEFGAGWTVTKVTGMQETCPNSGSGCTVYSCHVTNNTGGNT